MKGKRALLALVLVAGGCSRNTGPADVSASDACAFCRMAVSDARFAGQVTAAGEEPKFFDDIGCLAGWLKDGDAGAAAVFVADHRTRQWVRAADAVYTRTSIATPMGSGLVAHADAASRDADPEARGQPASAAEVFGRTIPGGNDER